MRNREQWLSRTSVAKATDGLITVLAVLAVLDEHPPVAWRGAVTLSGTTLAVALVDTYAETIAGMLAHQRRLTTTELREIWRDVSPGLVGAQAPTLVLLPSAFGLFPVERPPAIAEVVAFLLLFGHCWRVGKTLYQHWLRQLISALGFVVIGRFIVAVKAVFHRYPGRACGGCAAAWTGKRPTLVRRCGTGVTAGEVASSEAVAWVARRGMLPTHEEGG